MVSFTQSVNKEKQCENMHKIINVINTYTVKRISNIKEIPIIITPIEDKKNLITFMHSHKYFYKNLLTQILSKKLSYKCIHIFGIRLDDKKKFLSIHQKLVKFN
ncbi:hypothetical protein ACKWTF_002588 [Chironomus riparius]